MEDKNIHRTPDEDNDIKIAGSAGGADAVKAAEPDDIENYDRMRRNGDLSRARRLGASLAGNIDSLYDALGAEAQDDTVALHSKLLTVFSVVAALESLLPNRMLVRTALNVFYDTLKKDFPELYDSMSVSGAVTFYYLEYRKLGKTAADIGGKFAMLCGREEDDVLMTLGLDIFTRGFDHVRTLIDDMAFAG